MRPWLPILGNRWPALLFGLAVAGVVFLPLPATGIAQERTIRIEAQSFEYAPAEITVQPGDRVTLEVVAADVTHGLSLDGYNLEVTAEPGHTARLTFVADQPGVFRFRCSVTCGPLHPFMLGQLQVGPDWGLVRGVGLALVAALAGAWRMRR